jgi:hypothetical protein
MIGNLMAYYLLWVYEVRVKIQTSPEIGSWLYGHAQAVVRINSEDAAEKITKVTARHWPCRDSEGGCRHIRNVPHGLLKL